MGNVPRVLPAGLAAHITRGSWQVPAIFQLIQNAGGVDADEMYRVFNMGTGMVIIASREQAAQLAQDIPNAYTIGSIVRHKSGERVILD